MAKSRVLTVKFLIFSYNVHMIRKIAIISSVLIAFIGGYKLRDYAENENLNDPKVEINYVYDGDTIFVNISNWPDIVGDKIGIRVRGIDCPELHDSRKDQRNEAAKAKEFVVQKIKNADSIKIKNLSRDKYFRILADFYIDDQNLSSLLLEKKLAKPYNGGTKK